MTIDLTPDEHAALIAILADEPDVLRSRNYPTPEEGEFYDVVDVLLDKLTNAD